MNRVLVISWWLVTSIVAASELDLSLQSDALQVQARDSESVSWTKLVRRTGKTGPSDARESSPQAKRPRRLDFSSKSSSEDTRSPLRSPSSGQDTPLSSNTRRGSSAFALSPSVSSDSHGTTSIRTRADGPAYISVGKADPTHVPLSHQVSHKSWDMERLTSRAWIHHPQDAARDAYTRKAEMIVKGSRVQARVDTTRGGSGYIRTKGRAGYRSVKINPGEIASLTANAPRDRHGDVESRARLKAKLSGGGLITAEGHYEDQSSSPRRIGSFPRLSSGDLANHDRSRDNLLPPLNSSPPASSSGNGQPKDDPNRRRSGRERSGGVPSNGRPGGPLSDPKKNGNSPGRSSRSGSQKSGSNGGSKEGKPNGNGSNGNGSDGSDSGVNDSEGNGTDGSGFDGV